MTLSREFEFTFFVGDTPQFFGRDDEVPPETFQGIHNLPPLPDPLRFILILRLIEPEPDLVIVSEALHIGHLKADGSMEMLKVTTLTQAEARGRTRVDVPRGVGVRHGYDGVSLLTNKAKVHTDLLRERAPSDPFEAFSAIVMDDLITIVPNPGSLIVVVPEGCKLVAGFGTAALSGAEGPTARSFVIGETFQGRQWLWQFNEQEVAGN